MFTLTLQSSVVVYVPTTVNRNQPADNTQYVRLVEHKLARWFGGTTTTEGRGGYIATTDEHISEKVYIVKAFCTTAQLETYYPDVAALCYQLCQELGQESIAIEINGKMQLLYGS